MKKNDDAIQKLFDDYAEDLNERADLGQKAKAAMVAKNAKQRKLNVWKWLAPICCALIVCIVGVSVFGPTGLFWQTGTGNGEGQGTTQTLTYYALSEVKGRSVTLSDCDATLNVSQLKDDGDYQVVYERYYGFYFESGELAYVKALLGVRSDEGFCEITLIAEVDGVVRQDLRDDYRRYLKNSDKSTMFTDLDDKGEYLTNAYFNARGHHFYVYAMTGANDRLAEKIISKIL